jgi:hypothetical protein
MIGSTSSGCKFNGKNPVDSNAAFRLVFNGGWTFNASGSTSNGTNAFANTFLSGTSVNDNDNHLSSYMLNITTYSGVNKTWIGAGSGSSYFMIAQFGSPAKLNYAPKIADGITSSSDASPQGFNLTTTTGSSFQNMYRNGTLFHAGSGKGVGTIGNSVFIGALGYQTLNIQHYDNTYAFATIGLGLSDAEQLTLSNIINTFQTSLGRNTY